MTKSLPSFHDCYLLGYSVDCLGRRIELEFGRNHERGEELRKLVFEDVAGYRFLNDAFGNVILDLEEVTVDAILADFGVEITESYHSSGAPGPWAADLGAALIQLQRDNVRGFVLTSSYGLSGWLLAEKVFVVANIDRNPAKPNP